MNIKKILLGIPFFSDCSPEQIERISCSVVKKNVKKGDFIFRKGEASEGCYYLCNGLVKILFLSEDGNEKVVDIVDSDRLFGESLMFSEKPLLVHAQALNNSQILYLPAKIVLDEMARDSGLNRKIIAGMSKSIDRLMADLESYSLYSAKQRIIEYLLHELPDKETARQVVVLKVNKCLIASRLNLTKEHFSRVLHGLLAGGLIGIEGRKVSIPDVQQLRMQLQ